MDWEPSPTSQQCRMTPPFDEEPIHDDDESESDATPPPCRRQKPARKRNVDPAEPAVPPDELKAPRAKKSCLSDAERKAGLEDDPWTLAVRPTNVICRGCSRQIQLDKRSQYYPGLWLKHRDRCGGVKRGRKQLEVSAFVRSHLDNLLSHWA
ncbi:hypothetical protein B0H17DRAFT_1042978 [Mycena rosella]|uniref:Uncharacterized protein n=1 Tax=Mycena rosella TaxID=1033263 RepID=A0AAD7DYL4_MYCRO|nr:hypothetical protein B0H17DRAFT_1042978 [Mycena rosella]